MGKALTVSIRVTGARETLAAFRKLPREANDSLREHTQKLSKSLAEDVAAAAKTRGRQAALMARTVKANRDRVPSITAGGTRKVGRHRVPAGKLIYASEFGQNKRSGWYAAPRYNDSAGRQYGKHLGRGSYWFFRTVEARQHMISLAWRNIADDIVRTWEHG